MTTSFLTDHGIMVPAVTADQMREVDRVAIEETGPNLFQMMENAGRNLASHALELLGDRWREARVVVLAGGGGNGGGGICAARHLANREVDVALVLSNPDQLGTVPAWQRTVFGGTRGHEVGIETLDRQRPDLIIDALIGYGLREAPLGSAATLITWANASGARIVALDVPSGVNATSGECPGVYIRAHTTITLALPKTGLGGEATGDLWLADIGIPRATYARAGVSYADPFGTRYRVLIRR
ncbi:MAG: NAD(P)H-hydrate epimerase [Vicinamibacterales bacterium]